MDIKEIIKWFIPCFHILLNISATMDVRAVIICFLIFNSCPSYGRANHVVLSENSLDNAKNVELVDEKDNLNLNQSGVEKSYGLDDASSNDFSVGRTFGRPFKKMVAALIPLVFQIGAASTWAVIAALVGVKTLFVTLAILKILLVAGAAKLGALFASKGHHQDHHQQHKEIHLHIHGGQHTSAPHEEYLSTPWSRTDVEPENSYANLFVNPYSYAVAAGPQTIRTPYGNYMKVD